MKRYKSVFINAYSVMAFVDRAVLADVT